jgi:hypothetical protein
MNYYYHDASASSSAAAATTHQQHPGLRQTPVYPDFDPIIFSPAVRRRRRTTKTQHTALEALFARVHQPNNVQRREVAREVGMDDKQVQVSALLLLLSFLSFSFFFFRELALVGWSPARASERA